VVQDGAEERGGQGPASPQRTTMPVIELEQRILAPIERVFDLARSVDLHVRSASQTRERVVGGVTSGLLGLGDCVTFRGKHFGLWFELTATVDAFDRPWHFRDRMVEGTFARLVHDHDFRQDGTATVLCDRIDFSSPLGPLGRLVDGLFLRSHLERFLRRRAEVIKVVAESDEWREYLEGD